MTQTELDLLLVYNTLELLLLIVLNNLNPAAGGTILCVSINVMTHVSIHVPLSSCEMGNV